MAETTATPSAPAAAAAAPAAAASPATTAAPASTPAAVAAPATTATPANPHEGKTSQEIIEQTFKDRLKFDDNGKITNVEEATGHKAEEIDAANDPNKIADETTPAKKVDEKTADGETKEADGETKTADGETEAGADENPYEASEGIAAKDLRDKIDASPALKQAFAENPELRNQVFANARMAARVDDYEQIFLSPAEAKVAAEAHGSYAMLGGLLGAVNPAQPESVQAFTRGMIEQTYLRNEDGEVLKNDKGEPRSSGAVGRYLKSMFALRLGNEMDGLQGQLVEAQRAGDDDRIEEISRDMEHAQWVAARLGLRPTAGADEDSLPEEVKRERAAIAEREKALDARETAARQKQESDFYEGVEVGTQKVFDVELERFLKTATGIDDHNRGITIRNIKVALEEAINKNSVYGSRYAEIERAANVNGFTPKLQQKLISLNLETMRSILAKPNGVAQKALTAAGASLLGKQSEADEAQAARESASRGDTRTALGTSRPGGAQTTMQIREDIVASYKAAHQGDQPDEAYIIGEQLKRGFAAAGAAR